MKISNTMTDEAILVELGTRLARRRLDLQLTQAAVAEKAGVAMAKGWKSLVTAGIAMGMLGKVIANFIGIAIFKWLS